MKLRRKNNMHKKFYSIYEIADILGICYAKALEWVKYSGVQYVKVGRTYHVSIQAFNKFTLSGASED